LVAVAVQLLNAVAELLSEAVASLLLDAPAELLLVAVASLLPIAVAVLLSEAVASLLPTAPAELFFVALALLLTAASAELSLVATAWDVESDEQLLGPLSTLVSPLLLTHTSAPPWARATPETLIIRAAIIIAPSVINKSMRLIISASLSLGGGG
jgi:hypothetical protein